MRLTLGLSHHAWLRDADGLAAAHTLEVARAADEAGIDAIWASEDPEGWDAFAVLSAIAAVTSHALLGASVTNPYARHPNALAASLATLDHLSGGRAALGIGRGQVEWHRDALGVETGEPLRVLRETVALLRDWWTPPHVASSPADGCLRVRDWERVVHPSQPHVPIYLAAAGPRALDLAGTDCDGVIFNMLTSHEALHDMIPRVRAAAAAAGRDPASLTFILRTNAVVVDDPAAARKALAREKTLLALIATLPGMEQLVRSEAFDVPAILDRVGTAMRTSETLAAGGGFPALRRNGDLAAARQAMPDDFIRQLAILGPLPEVRARLRGLAELGVTHVGVDPPQNAASSDDWRRLLRDLGHRQ